MSLKGSAGPLDYVVKVHKFGQVLRNVTLIFEFQLILTWSVGKPVGYDSMYAPTLSHQAWNLDRSLPS